VRALLRRLRALSHGAALDRRLDVELRVHLDMETDST
jgi:hypothetical protein